MLHVRSEGSNQFMSSRILQNGVVLTSLWYRHMWYTAILWTTQGAKIRGANSGACCWTPTTEHCAGQIIEITHQGEPCLLVPASDKDCSMTVEKSIWNSMQKRKRCFQRYWTCYLEWHHYRVKGLSFSICCWEGLEWRNSRQTTEGCNEVACCGPPAGIHIQTPGSNLST